MDTPAAELPDRQRVLDRRPGILATAQQTLLRYFCKTHCHALQIESSVNIQAVILLSAYAR